MTGGGIIIELDFELRFIAKHGLYDHHIKWLLELQYFTVLFCFVQLGDGRDDGKPGYFGKN